MGASNYSFVNGGLDPRRHGFARLPQPSLTQEGIFGHICIGTLSGLQNVLLRNARGREGLHATMPRSLEVGEMRRTVLVLVLVLAVTLATVSGFAQAKKSEKPEKAKDPVCGLMVDKDPALSAAYKGETYYFCSKADMDQFKKSPEKYVKK